ncbi:MAG: glycosyltransferase family 9 protein [Paludibacteraceae bacterium]
MTCLILRLATLGNVAMTVPVIASLSARYPECRWVVAAQKPLAAMFHGMPNVHYHEVHLRTIAGLSRVYRELASYRPDMVFDLHGIFATRILCAGFRLRGIPVYTIDNECAAKRLLTLRGAKKRAPLHTEFQRYADTFRRAGFDTNEHFTALPVNAQAAQAVRLRFGTKRGRWIGIAPFAKSKSNMLPYRVMKEVIQALSAREDTRLFLFGAGKVECEMLRQWASIFPNTESVAGCLPLEQELELMRELDTMLCMDSANQHLSSLVRLRAVSVWCATHPSTGFMGWKQSPNDIIQHTDLSCRPCTCHGTNRCRYRNFACKQFIAKDIIQRI